jgi:hypothetical protein
MDGWVVVSCLDCWQEIQVVAQDSRAQFDELLVDFGWQPVRHDVELPQAFCPDHRRSR